MSTMTLTIVQPIEQHYNAITGTGELHCQFLPTEFAKLQLRVRCHHIRSVALKRHVYLLLY